MLELSQQANFRNEYFLCFEKGAEKGDAFTSRPPHFRIGQNRQKCEI